MTHFGDAKFIRAISWDYGFLRVAWSVAYYERELVRSPGAIDMSFFMGALWASIVY